MKPKRPTNGSNLSDLPNKLATLSAWQIERGLTEAVRAVGAAALENDRLRDVLARIANCAPAEEKQTRVWAARALVHHQPNGRIQ